MSEYLSQLPSHALITIVPLLENACNKKSLYVEAYSNLNGWVLIFQVDFNKAYFYLLPHIGNIRCIYKHNKIKSESLCTCKL